MRQKKKNNDRSCCISLVVLNLALIPPQVKCFTKFNRISARFKDGLMVHAYRVVYRAKKFYCIDFPIQLVSLFLSGCVHYSPCLFSIFSTTEEENASSC